MGDVKTRRRSRSRVRKKDEVPGDDFHALFFSGREREAEGRRLSLSFTYPRLRQGFVLGDQERQARQYAQAQVGFSSRRRNRTGEGPHLNEGGQHVVARDVTVRSSAKYAFDPDNSSILVAGESGVGVQVTRKLKDMGAWVWMMQSTDEKRAEVEQMMAILVNGDPAVPTDVTRVMSEIDDLDLVVASGDSMGNLLEAAQDAGVKRFVLVTEKAVESSDSDMELIVVEPTGEDVATLAVDALFST